MQSKLVDSLISGKLTGIRGATFDPKNSAYILLYQNGTVGVYSVAPKLAYHDYMEYQVSPDGTISKSGRQPKNFFLENNLNSLFASILNNNGKISDLTQEQIDATDCVDGRFVTSVLFYNPKSEQKLETLNIEDYALSPEQKQQFQKSKTYYESITARQDIKDAKASLIAKISKFVETMIVNNQKAGRSAWTKQGMLALNIRASLEQEQTILSEYMALIQRYSGMGLSSNVTLNSLFNEAVATTKWTLGYEVDFSVTDFLYLWPRGSSMPKTEKAVAPTNPAVAIVQQS